MDTTLLVVAAALVVAAGGLLFARSRMGASLERLAAARRCLPGEAAALGAGTLVHVSGAAEPGSAGPMQAPVSGQEVVWHRVLVTEEFQKTRRDSQGTTRTSTETRTVSDDRTATPFYLADGEEHLELVPSRREGVRDAPVLAHERNATGGIRIGRLELSGGNRQQVKEWGVPVGTRLHAVGELSTGYGGLRLDANVDRRLRVSLLDPQTQTARTGRSRTMVTVAAAVCAVLAIVVLAMGFAG